MKKPALRICALLLSIALLLAGCSMPDFDKILSGNNKIVAFSDMEYSRPDIDALISLQEACDGEFADADKLMERVYEFYDAYNSFYTNSNLAYIHYCQDMTDSYWEAEYRFCSDNSAEVDAALDTLYYALADSKFRDELEAEDYFGEGFFDAYEGESVWDEAFVALVNEETALVNEYYTLAAKATQEQPYSALYETAYADRLAQIYAELVIQRKRIAQYAGYDSYPEFAYDFYYGRDYTPQQSLTYLEQIRQELTPLYLDAAASDVWYLGSRASSERQTFRYVKQCAQKMGGTVAEAFSLLEEAELYDLEYSDNKYNASFELYLSSYYEPFVFLNAERTLYDKLSFAHEFGHFVNDYACGGSLAGIDVAEVFSQAMEYLSLCYGSDTHDLERLKMADCLCTYVEQAAYAAFEYQVYALADDAITPETISSLYVQVCKDYGLDVWDTAPLGYLQIEHFYTSPMYVISYVVSNDVAFQIYQREREKTGEGLALYERVLDSDDTYLIEFAERAGLESPFASGRAAAVRDTLSEILT